MEFKTISGIEINFTKPSSLDRGLSFGNIGAKYSIME